MVILIHSSFLSGYWHITSLHVGGFFFWFISFVPLEVIYFKFLIIKM